MSAIGLSPASQFPARSRAKVTSAENGPNVRKRKVKLDYDLAAPRRISWAVVGVTLLVPFAILFLLATSVPGQSPSPTPDSLIKIAVSEGDLVHLGDVVDVDVLGSLDYDWRGTLTPEGYLNGLDKIQDPVYALCRSESELAAEIARSYGKFLRDPKIVVRIVDRSGRALTVVDGAILKPQRFQIRRPVFLSELIILSGGITDNSNGRISIYRPRSLNCMDRAQRLQDHGRTLIKAEQGNDTRSVDIRVSDLLAGQEGSNPEILSGDIVTVEEAAPIYVIGGVGNPRRVPYREQTTLTRAIAASGGVSKDGVDSEITIFRRDGRSTEIIEVDLNSIVAGHGDDILLKPLDVVNVGQKGRAKPKLPPSLDADIRERRPVLPVRVIDR